MKDQIEKSYTRTIQGKGSQYKIDNKVEFCFSQFLKIIFLV